MRPFCRDSPAGKCEPGRPADIATPLGSPDPLLRWSNYSLAIRCGEAALPPPLGRCPQNFHILWAERAVLQLLPSQSRLTACQLSQRESQGCGTTNSNSSPCRKNPGLLRSPGLPVYASALCASSRSLRICSFWGQAFSHCPQPTQASAWTGRAA